MIYAKAAINKEIIYVNVSYNSFSRIDCSLTCRDHANKTT